MNITYILHMVGGPLDGVRDFVWEWNDTEKGCEGERTGKMLFDGLHYQCNLEKTKAHYVRGRATPELLQEYL